MAADAGIMNSEPEAGKTAGLVAGGFAESYATAATTGVPVSSATRRGVRSARSRAMRSRGRRRPDVRVQGWGWGGGWRFGCAEAAAGLILDR
jgi:hypothetical protein